MKKLYLVDVSSMFFRAFYAIRSLTNPAGLPVNAVYGLLSMTVKLLREIRPDYMAFCFDRPEPSFRKEMDPNYKAHRTEMPADLVPQLPYIRKLAEALGIPCFDKAGFEADDLIGTLTHFGRQHGLEVVIVSGDKDFGQLVQPFVSMYDTMKDVRYDDAGVLAKWGVEPRKVIDFLAIVGDSSDNVPGVAGIGEKGAQKLLSEFDSIEDIYGHLDRISSASVRAKLEASRDNAFLSKKLVTIVCDVPIGMSLEDLKLKPIVREELSALLAELDFKSFAKTLLGEASVFNPSSPAQPDTTASPDAGAEKNVTNFTRPYSGPGAAPALPEVRATAPEAKPENMSEQRLDLAGLEKWLKTGEETWALQTERGSYLAQEESGGRYAIAEVAAFGPELGELLSAKKLKLKGFDVKDFAKHHGVRNPTVIWDQMLAAYVIRAGPITSAQALFTLYSGQPLPELPTPSQILGAHLLLEGHLRKKIETLKAEKVLFDIELPLVPVLLSMEQAGILIDTQELKRQSETLARDIGVAEKDIHQHAGEVFNVGSPKQLGHILFEKLKLPPGKKTKTGFSTDNEVLEKLSTSHPIIARILEWRELSKLRSTYVDALPQLVDKRTGRVHTTFNQALTATGRLSSTNPNLQNIPIRTERGNQVRKAFIAGAEHVLLSADYSQIELRILAHITGDEGLVRAFEQNLDIHAATAAEVFEVDLKDVTPEQRRRAKAVNFGLAYGQSAFGLAETLRIPRGEAAEIINRYFTRFPGVKTYMADTVEEAKKLGYVETIFGRRRYLDELFSSSAMVRKFGERAAINAPIQGAASDLVKLAMIKVGHPAHARPLLQVHDELVFEVEQERADEVSRVVAAKMEGAAELRVPLKVNTGHGRTWLDAHA